MLMRGGFVLAVILCLSSCARGANHAPDLFLGRWELDAKASRYAPGTCPKRMTIEMTMEERGVHYHSETVPATGEPFDVDYTAKYDGRPVMVTGSRGMMLPVALTRVDVRHVKAVYSNGFQVEATSERVLSEDGKTMTITTTSRNKSGREQVNRGLYRRLALP